MNVVFPLLFHADDDAGYWVEGVGALRGLYSQGDDLDEARRHAREALSLMLEAMLADGHPVPRPERDVVGEHVEWVMPDHDLIAPLVMRWAREDARVTQAELAARLHVTKQAIQKLERPGANPRIQTLARVAEALGHPFGIYL